MKDKKKQICYDTSLSYFILVPQKFVITKNARKKEKNYCIKINFQI